MDDQAGDSGRLVVGQIPVHDPIEIADRHSAIDVNRSVGLAPHARHGDIVFVGDVSDDLLKDVFQRHQTFDFAVFVHHKRKGRLAAAEGLELFRNRTRLRYELRRRH
jgi:hypothetical protein